MFRLLDLRRSSAGFVGVVLSLGFHAAVHGQDVGTLAGVVVDDLSGQPLLHAVVSLPGLDVEQTTVDDGAFLFEGIPFGSHEVRFDALGYVSVAQPLDIASGDFLQIRLDPVAAVLDQIMVMAGRAPGSGGGGDVLHVPASDRPWQSALDLLEDQVPGVLVRRGGGLGNGAAILIRGINSFRSDGAPAIFVDGVRIINDQTGPQSFHALEMISAEVVSRIRVLKGASGSSGYANGANGVILVETLRGSGDAPQ